MKLLVAGGRNNFISPEGYKYLDDLHNKYKFKELVNGQARGIDTDAAEWALKNGINVIKFPPDYKRHGRKAPILRNKNMAWYCSEEDICVIMPGGRGSQNMLETAIRRGMDVINLIDRMDLVNEN